MMPTSLFLRSVPSAIGLASVLFLLSLAGCGADNPVPAYLKNTWGITISGFSGDLEVAADGTQSYAGTGRITVDGLGTKELKSTTLVSPMAQGGDITLFVSNLDGSEERYFLYDQVQSYITIGDLTKGVAVSKRPDNSYEVWAFDGDNKDQFLTVPNGFEALKLVEQYNSFKTISPYILLAAVSIGHTSTPEARVPVHCGDTAAAPVVCDIFKEFCDCAACLVLNRKGACNLCPKL